MTLSFYSCSIRRFDRLWMLRLHSVLEYSTARPSVLVHPGLEVNSLALSLLARVVHDLLDP